MKIQQKKIETYIWHTVQMSGTKSSLAAKIPKGWNSFLYGLHHFPNMPAQFKIEYEPCIFSCAFLDKM